MGLIAAAALVLILIFSILDVVLMLVTDMARQVVVRISYRFQLTHNT